MILGAFGDSFLFGSDLSDIQDYDSINWHCSSKLTYPALIAKQLQLDYYCTALPAQGNKVIADDVIRAVNYHSNKMFYIINWTWIDRFEYMGESRCGGAEGWESTLPTKKDLKSSFYYKHFHSDLDSKLSSLMFINTALEILCNNNCKFIMTYMDDLLFDKTFHCSSTIDYLQDKISPYFSTFSEDNFLTWSRKNNFPISDHWHPLEHAHEKAAEYWVPKVRTLLNTTAKED